MPVREALKRLDAEGLVQLTNNRGAQVTKHSLEEIGEIFDLRIMLEVDLFRRAIPLMTAADFTRCSRILDEMELSYDADDVGRWGALNYEYHSTLYAAANRRLTNDLLQTHQLAIRPLCTDASERDETARTGEGRPSPPSGSGETGRNRRCL